MHAVDGLRLFFSVIYDFSKDKVTKDYNLAKLEESKSTKTSALTFRSRKRPAVTHLTETKFIDAFYVFLRDSGFSETTKMKKMQSVSSVLMVLEELYTSEALIDVLNARKSLEQIRVARISV
mgnify:CR=1 FL=1